MRGRIRGVDNGRVRNSHRTRVRERLAVPGRERGYAQVAVALVAGGLGFGGPDGVQRGEMVRVDKVALTERGSGRGVARDESPGPLRDLCCLLVRAYPGRWA